MTTKTAKIPGTDDAWESGALGKDDEHAKRFEGDIDVEVDEALELQMISIRLPKYIINGFKFIASRNNDIGYQTLMRQILHRFVVCEMKRITTEMSDQMPKEMIPMKLRA